MKFIHKFGTDTIASVFSVGLTFGILAVPIFASSGQKSGNVMYAIRLVLQS